MADIIRIGFGMKRQNPFDARGQSTRPASRGIFGWSTSFHAAAEV